MYKNNVYFETYHKRIKNETSISIDVHYRSIKGSCVSKSSVLCMERRSHRRLNMPSQSPLPPGRRPCDSSAAAPGPVRAVSRLGIERQTLSWFIMACRRCNDRPAHLSSRQPIASPARRSGRPCDRLALHLHPASSMDSLPDLTPPAFLKECA